MDSSLDSFSSALKALNAEADPGTWNKIKFSKPIN